jgi:hypothetical protein
MEGNFSHWKPENRKLVEDSRAILAKHQIDLQGDINVVWAENTGHSVEYARKVHDALQKASPEGREAVVDALNEIAKELQQPPTP